MEGGLVVTTDPVEEPITSVEAKAFARIDTAADDTLVATLIKAARKYAEPILNRTMVTTTYTWTLDRFPCFETLRLPMGPLISITSINYVDTDGATQTWSDTKYDTDVATLVGRVRPSYGEVYPSTREQMNAVTIVFVAGEGDQAEQSDDMKLLIMCIVAGNYEKRLPVGQRREYLNEQIDSLFWKLSVVEA